MFNKKKKLFKSLVEQARKNIWLLEFRRFKTLEVREEVRKAYDTAKAKLSAILTDISKQKESPTMEEGEIRRLDDKKVLLEKDIKSYEDQLKNLDITVYGSKATSELPQGYIGLNQELDGNRESMQMLKSYIETL